MKKYLIIAIVFIALLSSCGSSRLTTKQETSIESGSGYQRKDITSLSQQNKKTETEDVTEETEEVTIVYDTSKPADPETGNFPVFSETKKTTKKGVNKKKDESNSTMLNQFCVVQSNDSMKIKDKKNENKQKQETTVPRQISRITWGLAALLGMFFVGWLAYRWKNTW